MRIKDPPVEFFVWLVFQMHGLQCSLQPLRHSPRRVDTGFFQILIVLAGEKKNLYTVSQYSSTWWIFRKGISMHQGQSCFAPFFEACPCEVRSWETICATVKSKEHRARVASCSKGSGQLNIQTSGHRFMGPSVHGSSSDSSMPQFAASQGLLFN